MKVYDPEFEIRNRLVNQTSPIKNENDLRDLQATIIRIGRDVLSDYKTEQSKSLSEENYNTALKNTVNAVANILIDKGCYLDIQDSEIQKRIEYTN